MITITIVIVLNESDMKLIEPSIPIIIENIVRMIQNTETRSGMKIMDITNMASVAITND